MWHLFALFTIQFKPEEKIINNEMALLAFQLIVARAEKYVTDKNNLS